MNRQTLLRQRIYKANRRQVKADRRYVLCWLQQALRGTDNPIIDAAVETGNKLGLPVVVYHGLDNRYPHASHRIHRFMLEASQSLTVDLGKRRLRFCRYVRRPQKVFPNLVHRLAEEAAAIFTDDMPTFVARRQATSVAAKVDVPLFLVDAACLVPGRQFPTLLEATKSFRAAHRPLRERYLAEHDDVMPTVRKYTRKLPLDHDAIEDYQSDQLDSLIEACGIDMTLPPAVDYPGHRQVAVHRLGDAMVNVVPRYKWTRNNPSLANSTAKLSPYMHFGVLGPREVTQAIHDADLHSAARWKFLDELLTWREYYFHLARHSDDPSAYSNVPAWARKTLAEHADDARPVIYTLDQLIHAETADDVWNAAQRQFLLDGWMHNNLRMYWVKQIIKWTAEPEEAWRIACYLNDRLSLDGRDPSTYGGIQWGFGRSKRAYRESPIYGWVPSKSASAILKRTGVRDWMAAELARPKPEIEIPDSSKRPTKRAARALPL
ncbi:photolyase PhrII [Rhodopirellula rubra]|uniref:Photolyase PhrII n=1 Tax=Aporhodopirellula rubra TaxID=980271 RepID=A0A7W5H8L2_9BACT|nr:deoxyribodipyrimidine photo-lyase [Aporhodopirellula rubra]MBB3209200.1 photolyase PhrII [Aporhodopirellula rubra]